MRQVTLDELYELASRAREDIWDAAKAGVPIPQKLRATLAQLAEEKTGRKDGGQRG